MIVAVSSLIVSLGLVISNIIHTLASTSFRILTCAPRGGVEDTVNDIESEIELTESIPAIAYNESSIF